MGFFESLFHRHDRKASVEHSSPATAAQHVASGVAYDAGLIQSLLQDHAQLGSIYGQIGDADEAGNFNEVRRLLAVFKLRLEAHLLSENVRFYTYIEQSMANDPANTELIRSFRREMNEIARQVVAFVRKYQPADLPMEVRSAFKADYAAVLEVLNRRLDSEEHNLYPIYQPH